VFRRAVEEGLIDPPRSIQAGMRGSLYEAGDLGASRELGFELISTDDVREEGIARTAARVRERVGEAKAYVSFDVDFLDPAFAPGTGTPEIGGFTSREAQELLRALSGIEIVGCDVVEVYPQYDGPGQITSLLAANVAFELLTLVALSKKGGARGQKAAAAERTG
jgi:agmatinase